MFKDRSFFFSQPLQQKERRVQRKKTKNRGTIHSFSLNYDNFLSKKGKNHFKSTFQSFHSINRSPLTSIHEKSVKNDYLLSKMCLLRLELSQKIRVLRVNSYHQQQAGDVSFHFYSLISTYLLVKHARGLFFLEHQCVY